MFGQESSPSEAGFPKEGQQGGEKCKTLANSGLKKHEVGQGPGPRAPRCCGYGAQRTRWGVGVRQEGRGRSAGWSAGRARGLGTVLQTQWSGCMLDGPGPAGVGSCASGEQV